MRFPPICLTLAAGFLVWGFFSSSTAGPPAAGESPTAADVAVGYLKYRKMTDKEVLVNPAIAILCARPAQKQIDQARLQDGPHANAAILIYMNDLAADAFAAKAAAYPVGAVIVKQKDPLGVGGMIKRSEGYDPAHGNWEYFYFDKPADVESGKIESCVQCHEAAKSSDHVYGTWKDRGTAFPNINLSLGTK